MQTWISDPNPEEFLDLSCIVWETSLFRYLRIIFSLEKQYIFLEKEGKPPPSTMDIITNFRTISMIFIVNLRSRKTNGLGRAP